MILSYRVMKVGKNGNITFKDQLERVGNTINLPVCGLQTVRILFPSDFRIHVACKKLKPYQ
jgi:hypothetical protein